MFARERAIFSLAHPGGRRGLLAAVVLGALFAGGCGPTTSANVTPLATASPSPVPAASGTAAVPTAGGPVVLSGLGYTLTLNLSASDAFPAGTTMSYTFSTSATKAGSVRRSQGTRATSDRKNLVTVTVQVNNAGSVDPAPSVDATVPNGTTLPTDPKRLTLDVYDHSNPTAGVTPFGGSATYGPAANNVHFTGLANSVVKHFQPNVSYDFYIDDNGDIQPIVSPVAVAVLVVDAEPDAGADGVAHAGTDRHPDTDRDARAVRRPRNVHVLPR